MISTYSINTSFSQHNAKNFINSISSGENKTYLFFGKSTPWTNESDVPTPVDSLSDYIDVMNNLIAINRIQASNLTLAIRKIVWTTGTVYQPYNDYLDLNDVDFYVLSTNNCVYKCLDNANGAPSTVAPTSDSLIPHQTSDGYKWQLMFQLSDADNIKWNNQSVIPVKEILAGDGSVQWNVQQAAIPGTIDYIEIQSAGSGYITDTVAITIEGDGTGATAHAVVVNNTISKIVIDSRGSGYTHATAKISGNAILRPIISPIKGHGSSAVDELLARYVIIASSFDKDASGNLPVNVSYRQIGLLMNPLSYGTSEVLNVPAEATNLTTLVVANSAGFELGEQIQDITTNSFANIVEIIDGSHITINNINGTFEARDSITGLTTGTSTTITSKTNPIIEPLSGQVIYVENREAVARSESQREDYKLIVAF